MPLSADAADAWREVFSDQLRTLNRSVLTACGVPVFLSTPEGTPWPLSDPSEAPFLQPAPRTLRQWSWGDTWEEEKTLGALFEYCLDPLHSLDVVAYTHDKGTRVPRTENPTRFAAQWEWRRRHEYFLFEVPEGCISALLSGTHDTCGSDFKELVYLPHYSGNFWWATCQHIRRLPHPMDYGGNACPFPPDSYCEGPGRQGPSVVSGAKFDLFLGPEFWLFSRPARMKACMQSWSPFESFSESPPYEGSECSGVDDCYEGGSIRIIDAWFGETGLERDVKSA